MGRTYYGMHKELEAAADELLRQSVATLPRSEKMDLLTPWKERDRLSREVYTNEGTPDPALRRGMYNRAWNPRNTHLNSQDGAGGRSTPLEGSVYFAEESYRDRAGQVFHGRIRPQSVCRRLSWGTNLRLQCPPCRRIIAAGPLVSCRKCGTVYVAEEMLACG